MNDSIRETEFFTTAELAEKLKMNVQVITRKVKAGEIYAYKIGKDWRIPDSSVEQWLDKKGNCGSTNNSVAKTNQSEDSAEQRNKRRYLLEYILAQLEPSRNYTEPELQKIVARQHKNWKKVYKELLSTGMIERDGDLIRRRKGYDLLAETV